LLVHKPSGTYDWTVILFGQSQMVIEFNLEV
jgi:hypothetical protein